METTKVTYNRAKTWQMALFVFNNTSTNVFMLLMGYAAYYGNGLAGLAIATTGFIATAMRMFDGITDPIIGFVIDKTNGKFGKFRPMIITGWLIMAVTTTLFYVTVHTVESEAGRLIAYIGIQMIYYIGYTFQTACTKSGQAALTNDPGQRPTFSLYDGIYNTLVFALLPLYILNSLVPKHTLVDAAGEVTLSGFLNSAFYLELSITLTIISGIFMILAIIGIWQKDRTEFFGLGEKGVQVKFKDYAEILMKNRAIQMLILAASTDKLAGMTMRATPVLIVIFSLTTGDKSIPGLLPTITMVPSIILLAIGIQFARKLGQKQALVGATWIAMTLGAIAGAMILFGPMETFSFANINLFTILFIIVYIAMGGAAGVSGNIVIPMIADCADYETYRSGRFVPGMMGTLFSFVDKMVSAFGATIQSLGWAAVGLTIIPNYETPLTPELLNVAVFMFVGMPILGWIASLIAMKFYPLTKEKMDEIQVEIQRIKNEA